MQLSLFKKSKSYIIFLFVSLIFITPSFSQIDGAREKDHDEIRQLLADVTKSINTEDTENIGNFFSKNYIYVGADQSVVTQRE